MNRFNSYKRKNKVAIALLSTLLGGNISSAKDMNHVSNQNVRLSQTTRKTDETSITSKKFFKPLVITVGALIVSGLVGFTIWGLTRNKKENDTPTKDDDNSNKIKTQDLKNKQEINDQNNKEQVTKEKEIEAHNKKLICDAIVLAKQANKLHCDENSLKNAMFELFDRLAKLDEKSLRGAKLLWDYFHTNKIFNISIEEFTNEKNKKENCVFLYLDNDDPEKAYGISWLPNNEVSISYDNEMVVDELKINKKIRCYEIFKNLKSPFEVKN